MMKNTLFSNLMRNAIIFLIFSSLVALFPISIDQGYHSSLLKRTEEKIGNTIITRFVDSNGNLQFAKNYRYATVKREYDGQERLIKESFFDEYGNQAILSGGYCEISYEYSNDETWLSYFDNNGNLLITEYGYAHTKRTYENGRLTEEHYYDLNKEPVQCSGLYYGTIREYDNDGTLQSLTFVDENNNPVKNSSGYAKIEYLSESTEMYYDENGNPTAASLGQYGVSYFRDEQGKIIQINYLDRNGNITTTKQGYASIKRVYKQKGYAEMYLNQYGEQIALDKGQYGMQYGGQHSYMVGKNGYLLICVENLILFVPYIVVIIGVLLCILFTILPEKISGLLLLAYTVFILYETLMFRETGDVRVNLHLFSYADKFFTDYPVRAEVINNIWLFVPFGAGVSVMKKNRAYMLPFLFSVIIEFVQLLTGSGLCELNDIFGNTLGGMIGFMIVREVQKIEVRKRDFNRKIFSGGVDSG